eukprot:760614-Hanusia_phi.AAC.3
MSRKKKSKAKKLKEQQKEGKTAIQKDNVSPKKRQRAIVDSDVSYLYYPLLSFITPPCWLHLLPRLLNACLTVSLLQVDCSSSSDEEGKLLADDYAENLVCSHRHPEDEQEDELEDIRAGILLHSITMVENEQILIEPVEPHRKRRRRAKAATSLKEVALKLSRFVYHSMSAAQSISFSVEEKNEALRIVRLGNAFGLQGSVKKAPMAQEVCFEWSRDAVIPNPSDVRKLLLALGEHVEDQWQGRMKDSKLSASLRKKPKQARSIFFSSAGQMQDGQKTRQPDESQEASGEVRDGGGDGQVHSSIYSSVANQLMAKMGYMPGQGDARRWLVLTLTALSGLGRKKDGIKVPLLAQQRKGKSGIGSCT